MGNATENKVVQPRLISVLASPEPLSIINLPDDAVSYGHSYEIGVSELNS